MTRKNSTAPQPSRPLHSLDDLLGNPPTDELCKIGRFEQDDPRGDTLRQLLADLRWTSRQLSNALSDRGIAFSASLIAAHRSGKCVCSRQRVSS